MSEIVPGTKLKLSDGTEVTVETFWNQGKNRVFKLTDGRTMFDLHKELEADKISIIEPYKKKVWKETTEEERDFGEGVDDSQR